MRADFPRNREQSTDPVGVHVAWKKIDSFLSMASCQFKKNFFEDVFDSNIFRVAIFLFQILLLDTWKYSI